MTAKAMPPEQQMTGEGQPSANGQGQSPAGGQGDRQTTHSRSQTWASWAQVAAVIVAATVAFQGFKQGQEGIKQGQVTIERNTQTALRQSEDTQLSTAITSLGASDRAERIAGLLLLTRNTANRFSVRAKIGERPREVFDDYTTALQILSGYLANYGESFLTATGSGHAPAKFGRGFGLPPPPGIPLDVIDAANQVEYLVSEKMQHDVLALHHDKRPAIDLAHDELVGQPWPGVNFRWLWAFMPGIDLRGASLQGSAWGERDTLSNSYLQCADLHDANLRGVNLAGADLRGANVAGAHFQRANLTGADLSGAVVTGANFQGARMSDVKVKDVYGAALWPRQPAGLTMLPVKNWDQDACLANSKLDDHPILVSSRAAR